MNLVDRLHFNVIVSCIVAVSHLILERKKVLISKHYFEHYRSKLEFASLVGMVR